MPPSVEGPEMALGGEFVVQILRNRGVTAYVAYLDTESNRFFWAKVR